MYYLAQFNNFFNDKYINAGIVIKYFNKILHLSFYIGLKNCQRLIPFLFLVSSNTPFYDFY